MISIITEKDINEIKKIHSTYFKNEFEIESFMDPRTLRGWVVRGSNGKIITAGGVKAITEAVMVTNKAFSPEERKDAFLTILKAMIIACQDFEFDSLHAFIQDEKWLRHLKTVGFKETKGCSLVLKV